jgi:adenylosuccinate lyase
VEFLRRLNDVEMALEKEVTGQLSGAVGNYSLISPEVETLTLAKLGLKVETVSSQVVPRDRLAKIISVGGLLACAIERLALEIRHLHRSEVGEIKEGFAKGQTGSSTMPHKKNPVSAENLCGLSRVVRSHSMVAFENTLLWHERDISHSSAERLYLPDHFGILVYALDRLNQTVQNLEVNPGQIRKNLESQPQIFSSLVLHSLIEQNTAPRDEIYKLVQSAAFSSASLTEMLQTVSELAKKQGMNAELNSLSLSGISDHYRQRFFLVRERARLEQA